MPWRCTRLPAWLSWGESTVSGRVGKPAGSPLLQAEAGNGCTRTTPVRSRKVSWLVLGQVTPEVSTMALPTAGAVAATGGAGAAVSALGVAWSQLPNRESKIRALNGL